MHGEILSGKRKRTGKKAGRNDHDDRSKYSRDGEYSADNEQSSRREQKEPRRPRDRLRFKHLEGLRQFWEESDLSEIADQKAAEVQAFLKRGKNFQYVCLLLAAAILLAGMQVGKGMTSAEKYIVGGDGLVSGLLREKKSEQASFPLSVEAKKGRRSVKKDVTVVLEGDGSVRVEEKQDPKEELRRAIQQAVRDAETAGTRKVSLPSRMADGTVMTWKKKSSYEFLLLLAMGPLLCAFLYIQDKDKLKREEKERRESISRALPAFNDQLILLLNCGLVFHDAFQMIADGYRRQERNGYFYGLILRVQTRAENSKRSLMRVLSDIAEEEKNENFSRFAETVAANQIRGTDILEILEKERSRLWEERKGAAEKRGKLAETRLAVPLALLLLVLITVTAAPAALQM